VTKLPTATTKYCAYNTCSNIAQQKYCEIFAGVDNKRALEAATPINRLSHKQYVED